MVRRGSDGSSPSEGFAETPAKAPSFFVYSVNACHARALAGRGRRLLAEDEEQSTELGALRLGEAGEELVFGAAIMAIDALELSDGDTVLIVGATGGVGSLAVQLAARAGATVVAPALAEDEAYLRELGVSELLPRGGDLAAAARDQHLDGFDAVLDLVNYAPGVPASLVKERGRVASPTGAAGEGPGRTLVMAAPTPESLERLARLLAGGTLRVHVQATYELAQAPDALSAPGTTHSQGKLAIHIQ